MSYVPYYIWSGDQDLTRRLPSAEEARDALAIVGTAPVFVVAKGVAHMYRPEDIMEMNQWMLQHKRQRPDHFSFVIDTPCHRGVWGISISRKYPYDHSQQICASETCTFLIARSLYLADSHAVRFAGSSALSAFPLMSALICAFGICSIRFRSQQARASSS